MVGKRVAREHNSVSAGRIRLPPALEGLVEKFRHGGVVLRSKFVLSRLPLVRCHRGLVLELLLIERLDFRMSGNSGTALRSCHQIAR